MKQTKEIGVAVIGFGTVGAGVVETLQLNGDLLARRLGVRLAVRGIADLDLTTDRGVKVDPSLLTTDSAALIERPDVDVVVELIGGCGVAKTLVEKALSIGKPVVTANKKLLAEYGESLYKLAAEHHTEIFFEASVGGGIPIIKALREGLCANRIQAIYGILNGTCNYILTRMELEEASFDKVLKEAQKLGYAEAEPSLDIDGHDTAHKAAVLASLSYDAPVPLQQIHTEGIRGMDRMDIRYAGKMGYRIKLLAIMKESDGKVEVCVQPTLVPLDHQLAAVSGVYNAVLVQGDRVGNTLYYGRGAGRAATSSAVVADLADAATELQANALCWQAMLPTGASVTLREPDQIMARYYLRLSLQDKPGSLAKLTSVLGMHQIGIASVNQPEYAEPKKNAPPTEAGKSVHPSNTPYVTVLVVTDPASGHDIRVALNELSDIPHLMNMKPVRYRIEDFF